MVDEIILKRKWRPKNGNVLANDGQKPMMVGSDLPFFSAELFGRLPRIFSDFVCLMIGKSTAKLALLDWRRLGANMAGGNGRELQRLKMGDLCLNEMGGTNAGGAEEGMEYFDGDGDWVRKAAAAVNIFLHSSQKPHWIIIILTNRFHPSISRQTTSSKKG
jgi:hypothetical protein